MSRYPEESRHPEVKTKNKTPNNYFELGPPVVYEVKVFNQQLGPFGLNPKTWVCFNSKTTICVCTFWSLQFSVCFRGSDSCLKTLLRYFAEISTPLTEINTATASSKIHAPHNQSQERFPFTQNFGKVLLGISVWEKRGSFVTSSIRGSQWWPSRLIDRKKYGTGSKNNKDEKFANGTQIFQYNSQIKINSNRLCLTRVTHKPVALDVDS